MKDGRFDAAAFSAQAPYDEDYALVAQALVSLVPFLNHLDLGAGRGALVAALLELGKYSEGFELSLDAAEFMSPPVRERIWLGIGLEGWAPNGGPTHELVSSVEVLEHLPESEADRAVEAICARSSRSVYFSAAAPGQRGRGHVNCQPKDYWRAKFDRHGFELDRPTTFAFVRRIAACRRTWWLPRNAMILRRTQKR